MKTLLILNALWLSLPSIDGATGAEIGGEVYVPDRQLGVVGTIGARKSVAGDYSAIAGGVGVEARWYWRSDGPVGWFVGGRGDLALSRTRDVADDRDLGTALVLGAQGLFGYRLVPWRQLELTPSIGLGFRNEHDLSGRLPPWTLGSFTVGLEVGWLF
jgi:hypothetical protein